VAEEPAKASAMNCPNCNEPHTRVEESRRTAEVVYRVRICRVCRWRVTTEEKAAEEQSIPDAIRKPKKAQAIVKIE
jgi:transcriptional regulator NrdR family protein